MKTLTDTQFMIRFIIAGQQFITWIRLPAKLICTRLMVGLILWLSLAPAQAERVLQLNGSGFVDLPQLPAFKFGATDFAVEFWFKPNNTGSELGAIFTSDTYNTIAGATSTNGSWGLYWQAGAVRLLIHPSSSPVSTSLPGGSVGNAVSAPANIWHHVLVNFNRQQNTQLYVDGVLKDSGDPTPMLSWTYFKRNFDSTNAYRIGAERVGPDLHGTNNFKGAIDELRIWSRVRTASEVATAWSLRPQLNGSEPGLVAYYKFNLGSSLALSQGNVGDQGNATLTGLTTVDDPTLVLTTAQPPATDYCYAFNGVNQSLDTKITGAALAGNALSVEYWFKGPKLLSALRLQSGSAWLVSGWGWPQSVQNMINTSGSNNVTTVIAGAVGGVAGVQDGQWHHIAITWQRNTTNGFKNYVDGAQVGAVNTDNVPFPLINADIYLGSFNGTSEFLQGSLDEVRIWNRVLPTAEIQDHASNRRRLLGSDPGLVAYYTFNDGLTNGTLDNVTKTVALYQNMTTADRQVQDGLTFGAPALITLPNPAAGGLWLGEVSLTGVSEVAAGQTNTTPTATPFNFNIILHADTNGVVRLLKDVTIMQKRNTVSNLADIVLLTDDTLIPNYDGVLKRGGKLVGQRYSSVFYTFDGQFLPLSGGLGYGYSLQGTNYLPATQPTNPFRHLYHPQHKNPLDLSGKPYDITRKIRIDLMGGGITGVGEGRDRLEGTYREIISGLHNQDLITDGSIKLVRINTVSKLNN